MTGFVLDSLRTNDRLCNRIFLFLARSLEVSILFRVIPSTLAVDGTYGVNADTVSSITKMLALDVLPSVWSFDATDGFCWMAYGISVRLPFFFFASTPWTNQCYVSDASSSVWALYNRNKYIITLLSSFLLCQIASGVWQWTVPGGTRTCFFYPQFHSHP